MSGSLISSILSQEGRKPTETDIAVAVIWFRSLEDFSFSLSAKEVAEEMVAAGLASPNVSRLKKQLISDSRTAKAGTEGFRIKLQARKKLDEAYLSLLKSTPIKTSNSYIPLDLHNGSRKYLDKVILQINASYDGGLYDCSAVMCRRLLETLIIETYEHLGKSAEIKGPDGNYHMFQGLLNVILSDPQITLGRNAKKGLNELKALGDKSAHNRRFNARKDDLDPIRADVRTAAEELIHLANLA